MLQELSQFLFLSHVYKKKRKDQYLLLENSFPIIIFSYIEGIVSTYLVIYLYFKNFYNFLSLIFIKEKQYPTLRILLPIIFPLYQVINLILSILEEFSQFCFSHTYNQNKKRNQFTFICISLILSYLTKTKKRNQFTYYIFLISKGNSLSST